ncbi:MAG: ribonuclease E/G, partial [Eubacteriales bacterium]|nr:ribonuclease E/G [Eubacteriales bacterium]
MNRKIVITEFNSKKYLLDFSNSVCNGITVLSEADNIVGNIYIGRVENVVKNINAAFVEIKKGVKCYYSLNENQNHIFLNTKNNTTVNIGDKLLVQVSREAVKTKPATVTCRLEIPGKYIVVSADVSGVAVSSKIKKNPLALEIKNRLKEILTTLPAGFGFIVRTNAIDACSDDVISEALKLSNVYTRLYESSRYGMFFDKLYSSIPDYCNEINSIPTNDLEKVITDQKDIYDTILKAVPGLDCKKVVYYEDEMLELYKLYSLETLLKHSTDRKVWLKSGGYLIIDQTEAMTVIDVNSGKQTNGKAL